MKPVSPNPIAASEYFPDAIIVYGSFSLLDIVISLFNIFNFDCAVPKAYKRHFCHFHFLRIIT